MDKEAKQEAFKRPDAAQIKAWKKEHGDLHKITVEGKEIIIRQPGMIDLERAMAANPKKNKPMNFNRSIIANCKLYADPGLLEDDRLNLAVCSHIDEIIEIAEAKVEKL